MQSIKSILAWKNIAFLGSIIPLLIIVNESITRKLFAGQHHRHHRKSNPIASAILDRPELNVTNATDNPKKVDHPAGIVAMRVDVKNQQAPLVEKEKVAASPSRSDSTGVEESEHDGYIEIRKRQ